MDLLQLIVFVDQHGLLLNPLAVKLIATLFQIVAFPQQIDEFVLVGVFALVVGLAHEFVMQFVESAHLVLLLLVDVMALLDLHLIGDDQVLLVILFGQRLLSLLLQQFNLRLCVKLINANTGNFVQDVLQLNLFLRDVLV